MTKNVIFVDIDGPLLPQKMHYFGQNRKSGKEPENYVMFDQWAVRVHNLWARYSNAKIVFCTHWTHSWKPEELKDLMKYNGLGFDYHEHCVTPKKMSSNKVDEIYWWLEEHPECENFIAVEDDTTCRYLDEFIERRGLAVKGRWIKVDYSDGISMKNFTDGCEQFGIDQEVLLFEEFGIPILTPEEKARRAALIGSLM
jgi:hypothetical protein